MSSFSAARVFNGCRALFAPAKASTSTASSVAAASKTKASTTKSTKAKSAAKPKTTKSPNLVRPNSGILKLTPVSPALESFLGTPESSRADAVKKIWTYVKTNNLQNPQDKRQIFCDEKLKSVFDGREVVGFLEIGKLLSRHFVKAA